MNPAWHYCAIVAVVVAAALGLAAAARADEAARTLAPVLAQATPDPAAPDRPANTLTDVFALLSKCLQMPPIDIARPGMQITVRLAFTRDGDILGEPRFTFSTPGVSSEVRIAYQRAVADMLARCTPLNITKELGGAIAGRPFAFLINETRKEKKA